MERESLKKKKHKVDAKFKYLSWQGDSDSWVLSLIQYDCTAIKKLLGGGLVGHMRTRGVALICLVGPCLGEGRKVGLFFGEVFVRTSGAGGQPAGPWKPGVPWGIQ
jgi:hypothetical protein